MKHFNSVQRRSRRGEQTGIPSKGKSEKLSLLKDSTEGHADIPNHRNQMRDPPLLQYETVRLWGINFHPSSSSIKGTGI